MYDFLISEVWWMETIIAALIGAGAGLIGYALIYNINLKLIHKNTESLLSQHKDLSCEHKTLLERANNMNININTILNDTKDSKFRIEELAKKDINLSDITNNIAALSNKLSSFILENNQLKQQISERDQLINQFIEQNNNQYKSYKNDLEDEYER